MGVPGLWEVLEPVKTPLNLCELSNQTVAIDLSFWICQANGIKDWKFGNAHVKYLRNLFFRIKCLLLHSIKPVVVLEGNPTALKADTIKMRRVAREKTGGWVGSGRVHGEAFKRVMKECCELLDCLGVPYIQSPSEADIMCAVLNSSGMVDAVITDDVDVLLYGARKVYKNFSGDRESVDSYSMADITSKLHFTREHLIGIALLSGCDYTSGIPGIGIEKSKKLMTALTGETVLQRIVGWKDNQFLSELAKLPLKKPHCKTCGHPGKAQVHKKTGCHVCATDLSCVQSKEDLRCQCDWCEQYKIYQAHALELDVRKKALELDGFPEEQVKVKDEYFHCADTCPIPKKMLNWKQPNLEKLQEYVKNTMHWDYDKTLGYILPVLTLNQMVKVLQCEKESGADEDLLQPNRIVKTRKIKGKDLYEIEWQKLKSDTYTKDQYYITREPQGMFSSGYPKITEQYKEELRQKDEAKIKKTKERKSQKKSKNTKSVNNQRTLHEMTHNYRQKAKHSVCDDSGFVEGEDDIFDDKCNERNGIDTVTSQGKSMSDDLIDLTLQSCDTGGRDTKLAAQIGNDSSNIIDLTVDTFYDGKCQIPATSSPVDLTFDKSDEGGNFYSSSSVASRNLHDSAYQGAQSRPMNTCSAKIDSSYKHLSISSPIQFDEAEFSHSTPKRKTKSKVFKRGHTDPGNKQNSIQSYFPVKKFKLEPRK